jgi:hypothetical protein
MTKIILSNGVIHVKENYNEIIELICSSVGFIELLEINSGKKIFEQSIEGNSDYRILVNINLIQCVIS